MTDENVCKSPDAHGQPRPHHWKGSHSPNNLDPVPYHCGNCPAEGIFDESKGAVVVGKPKAKP